MGAVLQRIEADTCGPLSDQAGILPAGETSVASREEEVSRLPAGYAELYVDCLARVLRYLKLNWTAGLTLPDDRAV